MFEIEDKVVYGVNGVCEVTEIAVPPIKGIEGQYYYLQPVFDDKGIIYSPVDSKKVNMRAIISQSECKKLISKAKNCAKDESLNEKIHLQSMMLVLSLKILFHLCILLGIFTISRMRELRT